MNRSLKKFLYGIFYLTVLVLVILGIYGLFLRSGPTCSDKIQNQGETGIDCGGPCDSCGLSKINPLQALSVQYFGTTGGQAVIFAEAFNPNTDYGATSASYQFLIYGKNDQFLEQTPTSDVSFKPAETKYIFSLVPTAKYASISKIDLVFSNTNWQSGASFLPKPTLSAENLTTALVNSAVQVSGSVTNPSGLDLSNVKITALIFNKFGGPIFASQTFMPVLSGGGTTDFVVSFPADPSLNANFDATATQVFFDSQ